MTCILIVAVFFSAESKKLKCSRDISGGGGATAPFDKNTAPKENGKSTLLQQLATCWGCTTYNFLEEFWKRFIDVGNSILFYYVGTDTLLHMFPTEGP